MRGQNSKTASETATSGGTARSLSDPDAMMQPGEEEHLEVRSTCSGSSSRSSSSLTKAAAEACAKAEAARARAEFACWEMEIKMRQAELSATLDMLKAEKEAEAALAEASVFEAPIAEEVNGETSTLASEKQHGESRQVKDNTQPTQTYPSHAKSASSNISVIQSVILNIHQIKTRKTYQTQSSFHP